MNVFQSCSDTSDAIPLFPSQGLYLKPVAKLKISVQLPTLKLPGKSISNWEVMEKLRYYAAPEELISLKVSKSTLEVVRFEGEIENHSKVPAVLARLDGRSIKLSGFHESLKVRAAEAKPDFPTRHSWDSYFRDAKNMNEMKPGERPDTIHITNLPCKWFATKSDTSKPSEYILRKVFESFGEVRCVDIPMVDPFRSQMKSYISGIKMFSNNQNMIFEAYIQFTEYMCFVKTMDTLRGNKLLHKDPDGKVFCASIKVDFDKTKHLSDSSIKRRRIERERLMAKEKEREVKEQQAREEEERKLAAERKRIEEEKEAKLERQRQREERRKVKQLDRLKQREADEMNQKIATEERLLLIAQRRLESFRLLGELFNRLRIAKEKERDKYKDSQSSYKKCQDHSKKQSSDKMTDKLESNDQELRDKLVKKFKHSEQNDDTKPKQVYSHIDQREDNQMENLNSEYQAYNNFEENKSFHRGGPRGGRGGWFPRRRRGNIFRGNSFPPMPFQPFPNRGGGFFPPRGFPRWPRFRPGERGSGDHGFVPQPFIDPYYLDSVMNDQYYKYFHKITLGNKRSRSRSDSRSESFSQSSYYSRSRSRSYTRSRTRSRSRSRSKHYRSRSSSRRRSRTRSRSSSRKRSRSRKRHSSRRRSHSSRHSNSMKKRAKDSEEKQEENVDQERDRSYGERLSVHTWSRSPSRSRSLSWEKRKDEPSSSNKSQHKHKKEKKKKKKKKKKSSK